VFTIIGYAVVFGAVFRRFVLEGGPVAVLNQTVEFLIIAERRSAASWPVRRRKFWPLPPTVSKRRLAVAAISKPDYMIRSLLRDA
jgi:hypothetical protein